MKAIYILLLTVVIAEAQLVVKVSPVKVAGQKAVVPLTMRNNFAEHIESARAAVFLMDEEGKMVGQGNKWVIGGSENKIGLAAGATNTFQFVIVADKRLTTTNLTAKVTFTRVVLEGGKLADVSKDVNVQPPQRR
jgi:hypothetical protein